MADRPYPIVLTGLSQARCLVVGGGAVAERKIAGLLEAGARIVVVSPTLTPQLQDWAESERLQHIARAFESNDVAGATLVFAATDDPNVNAQVAEIAHEAGALINVADNPHAGNFHTVATVRRGDLLLTASTNGASPAVAALARRKLEAEFGPEYEELAALVADVRLELLRVLPASARAAILRQLASDQVLAWLREKRHERVRGYAQALLDTARTEIDQLPPANRQPLPANTHHPTPNTHHPAEAEHP